MHVKLFSSYPIEICNIIYALTEIYSKDCTTVVLYGSTATGNLTYILDKNKYDFYSDIEFYVIPKNGEDVDTKLLRKNLMEKSINFLKSLSYIDTIPFIDVCPVSESFFRNGQNRISTFELKNCGIVLKGDNVLDLLPDINKNNYNPKVQNIEIVKGLKILLLESYKWFLYKDVYTAKELSHFSYFLSSSFLNILRTLLPYMGYFEETVQGRINIINKALDIRNVYPEVICKQFEKVYIEKQTCDFSFNPKELFDLTYNGYKYLLCVLLECNNKILLEEIDKKKKSIFCGTDIKIYQLSLLLQFFILALDCINQINNNNGITDSEIKKVMEAFDKLISGKNTYKFINIVNKYEELEKVRWKIIGSKD